MVKLEEVTDEEFLKPQEGAEDEGEWDTDDESVISSEDGDTFDESLLDRIYALKDAVPPSARNSISSTFDTTYSWGRKALNFGGKTMWVIATSALLLGVPWALAFAEEQQVQDMEREMKMQQSANELLTQGSNAGTQARPAI
ncbi:MAG: mitochondrial import receptor protein [Bogoriella megaspora]|nr:MAG: mitochondrial import receptor protein [Bogoriella megaspora]